MLQYSYHLKKKLNVCIVIKQIYPVPVNWSAVNIHLCRLAVALLL